MAMAAAEREERGRLEKLCDSLTTETSGSVAAAVGLTGNGRVMTNSLIIRVNDQTDGALKLNADMEDTQFYYEAVIRTCGDTEMKDSQDGWGVPKAKIESGELLAAFGIGGSGLCIASFEVESKQPVGKRSRQGVSQTLGVKFSAEYGSFVEFVDPKNVVHRATVLSFALYVPKAKGANMVQAFGGQTVLIAYVFDATCVTTHFVVRFRP